MDEMRPAEQGKADWNWWDQSRPIRDPFAEMLRRAAAVWCFKLRQDMRDFLWS
jgi:hypothetical protein